MIDQDRSVVFFLTWPKGIRGHSVYRLLYLRSYYLLSLINTPINVRTHVYLWFAIFRNFLVWSVISLVQFESISRLRRFSLLTYTDYLRSWLLSCVLKQKECLFVMFTVFSNLMFSCNCLLVNVVMPCYWRNSKSSLASLPPSVIFPLLLTF